MQEKVYADKGYMRRRRAALKERWRAFMSDKKCQDCGENHPACLEWHHVREKMFTIGNAVTTARYVWERLMKEVAKCVVLCANCHKKRHYKRSRSLVEKH